MQRSEKHSVGHFTNEKEAGRAYNDEAKKNEMQLKPNFRRRQMPNDGEALVEQTITFWNPRGTGRNLRGHGHSFVPQVIQAAVKRIIAPHSNSSRREATAIYSARHS